MNLNLILGWTFLIIGLTGAGLQYWLWTFPMALDPSGTDPNGVTTAPRPLRMLHRCLGYAFLALYLLLLARMVPRVPFLGEGEASQATYAHVVLAIAIAPTLGIKIFILRRAQRLGKSLRALGSVVLVLALLAIGAVANPSLELSRLPRESARDLAGHKLLTKNCFDCHGASSIFSYDKGRWSKVIQEMEDKANDSGKPLALGADKEMLVQYLNRVLPEIED